MAMKTCPSCGEKYSDTYKNCPFCEEEEVLQEGGQIRRGGKRVAGGRRDLLTPTLLVLIVLMASLLVYLLKGDEIADKLGKDDPIDPPPAEEVQPPIDPIDPIAPVDPAEPEEPDGEDGEAGVMPDDPDQAPEPSDQPDTPDTPVTPPVTGKTDYEKAAALPAGLTLSTTDFSLFVAGESHTIAVTGGSGSYQWYSEDDGVASVDKSGKVTAVSRGDVKIVVTDGKKQGTCIVRVKVDGAKPAEPAETPKPTTAKLSSEDFTIHVGWTDVKLTVTGGSGPVTWSSQDTSVATVSADGVVKAVGKGTTTITAKVGGAALTCIVRVPK